MSFHFLHPFFHNNFVALQASVTANGLSCAWCDVIVFKLFQNSLDLPIKNSIGCLSKHIGVNGVIIIKY